MSKDLKDVSLHFEFGQNWQDYASGLDEEQVQRAMESLQRLLKKDELEGKSFLEIGSGSGIHTLSALRLGVTSARATDIDQGSVETTSSVLQKFAADMDWSSDLVSVFDLKTQGFDIVYSWGVLHHTGDMFTAIDKALAQVNPGGLACLALYGKTRLCWLWKLEKRLYVASPDIVRKFLRGLFVSIFRLACLVKGVNFKNYVANYQSDRGMSYYHDIHDWMGGYPYESIRPDTLISYVEARHFKLVRSITRPGGIGIFGAGCDEFVFRKT
jgi:2-polyprenyl-3-methyl-5-hydroxy-6-metoxy-1,4-benzoquinol methylase